VEAVGMKVEELTSLEKYNEMLVKWKEAGIGTGAEALIQNQFNYSGAFRPQPIEPVYDALYNDIAVADFTTEASEKFLRNLNYQYNNGLIDKEFYLRDTGEKIKAEFVAGRTGTFGDYMTYNTDTFEATKKINPEAEFAALPPGWNMPEGQLPYGGAPFPFGMIMGINHTTIDEERIAVWLYLEWMSQPEVLFTLQNGIEGQNYSGLDENGVPIKIEGFAGDSLLSPNNNKDYWCLVVEAPTFGTEEQTIKALKSFWSPPGYEYIIDDLFKFREQNLKYQVPAPLYTVPIESVSKYRADLASLFQKLYLDIVLGSPEEFDAKYEAGKKQWLAAGYQQILDEKQKAIDEGKVIYSKIQ
ncbi:ABC transporter substrate-binding protein, partial [Paenibacillus sp. MCAF20]